MFSWYHWIVVAVPVLAVCALAVRCRRYVRSVSDFLVAGRCAGRYVLLSGGMMGNLAVTSLVAWVETHYNNGWAFQFWNSLLTPLAIMLSLYGWITYRFRETRAMSAGQFFEMRYSRGLRRLAAVLRGGADLLGNCIGPAVAVRFFIYLLDIPHRIMVCGIPVRTFPFLLAACLALALLVILSGGRISLLVTDAAQGLVAYPLFVVVIVFVLCRFSWWDEIAPVMADRVPGESFLDPYDISQLRDFNLFALVVMFYRKIMGGEWVGNGYGTVAKSAHEGKMATLLGTFGSGLSTVMPFILVCCVLATMNHRHYADEAHRIRQELSVRVAEELSPDAALAEAVGAAAAAVPPQVHEIGVDPPLSRAASLDTPTLAAVRETLHEHLDEPSANKFFQGYRTTYMQQMLPVVMRTTFPRWLTALLLMLCILLVISTDDTRIFDIAMTWTQDFVLPFFRKAPSPRLHLAIFKAVVLLVGACFWLGSYLFAQLDYINMFITIGCSMWFTGAGAIVTLGLYWRRGTTAGAYASLLSAASISLGGILVQRNWAGAVLPWLAAHGLDGKVRHFLAAASSPFDPWIRWAVSDAEWVVKFPVNSVELSFIAMLVALLCYVTVSLLTCRKPFDLDRMLHRSIRSNDGALRANDGAACAANDGALRANDGALRANDGGASRQMTNDNNFVIAAEGRPSLPLEERRVIAAEGRPSLRGAPSFARRMMAHTVGITPEYRREDRVLAWVVFGHSIVYGFVGAFALVAICAKVFHWSVHAWSIKFFVTGLMVPLLFGIVTTVWFTWGTTRDLRRLFRDLETRVRDDRDNGMVEKR